MTSRLAAVAIAALSCAACANQGPMKPMGLGFHNQVDAHYAPPSSGSQDAPKLKWNDHKTTAPHMKQTLGGKILSAIALERVTGRKPDPRRFKELR